MNNISKPFVAWVTALKHDKFRIATLKLTFFYVLGTAAILLVSSVAVLVVFTPSKAISTEQSLVKIVEPEHGDWSLYEAREHLAVVIAVVDIVVLLVVSVLAYYLARRTLLPIKTMHEEQQRFMSDVAHELRTPLSVMQAGADTMLRKNRPAEVYEEFITDVQEEAGRLTRLSNQLLRLLSTDAIGQEVFSEVNLSKITKAQVRLFTPYAQKRSVTIVDNIETDIIASTESDSLIEIIQNILKNAIDYNKQGGTVTVTLSETKTEVLLKVIDTGIGISSGVQTTVFNRFVKDDAARTQSQSSGAGLGLSIVKILATKIGGKLALESTLGVGTTITVTLPKVHS